MRLPTKMQVFANFWPQKNVTTLHHSPYCPYLLFPKLKVKLKVLHFAEVAEIQEAVTDELKKVQKEDFLAAFQKLYDSAKACIYNNGAYLDKKSYVFSSCVFDLKKISPKTLDRTLYTGPLKYDEKSRKTYT